MISNPERNQTGSRNAQRYLVETIAAMSRRSLTQEENTVEAEPAVARAKKYSVVSTKPDGKKMTDVGTKAHTSQANAEKALTANRA